MSRYYWICYAGHLSTQQFAAEISGNPDILFYDCSFSPFLSKQINTIIVTQGSLS